MQKPRIRVFTVQRDKTYEYKDLAAEFGRGKYFLYLTPLQSNYFLPKTEEDHKLHLKNIGQ